MTRGASLHSVGEAKVDVKVWEYVFVGMSMAAYENYHQLEEDVATFGAMAVKLTSSGL